MRYLLILWLLSVWRAESATNYVDNVHLQETKYQLPKLRFVPDGRSEISLIFWNSTIHTISARFFNNLPRAEKVTLSGCRIQKIDNFSQPKVKFNYLDLSSNQLRRLQSSQFGWTRKLKVLNLSQNAIYEMYGGAFKGLTRLTELDLSGNQLKTLTPGVFAYLNNLEQLNLDGNSLTKLQSTHFTGLGRLTTLNLERNKLVRITNSTFRAALSLTTIFLSGNDISAVDSHAFDNLDMLKKLNLNNNQLTSFEAVVLPQDIEQLSLDDNDLETVKVEHYLNLTHLSLANNERIQWRPTMFAMLSELSHLSLAESNITGLLISDGLLQRLKNLISLDLSGNPIVVLNISALPVMKNLTHLNLGECKLNNLENAEEMKLKFPKLENLTITGNNLNCEIVDQLTNFFQSVIVENVCTKPKLSYIVDYLLEAVTDVTVPSTPPMTTDIFTSTLSQLAETSENAGTRTSTTKKIEDEENTDDIVIHSDQISTTVAAIDDDDQNENILRKLPMWSIIAMAIAPLCVGTLICLYQKCRKT